MNPHRSDETQAAIDAHWSRRAPIFHKIASHIAQADLWRGALNAAFRADAPLDVVDLGTGTGACAIIAASLGHRVRAFDGSSQMLEVAREAASKSGVEVSFENALISDIPVADASADIVTLRNVLWTLQDPIGGLATARRLLRPDGRVVVSDAQWSLAPEFRATYAPEIAGRLPLHDGITEDVMRRMLEDAGFDEVESWGHLFPASPYAGNVPMFLLTARPTGAAT